MDELVTSHNAARRHTHTDRKLVAPAGRVRLFLSTLLTSPPVSRIELASVGVFLAALGALVFGPHIAHGGFWLDDWGRAATYEFAPNPRYLNAVHAEAAAQGGKRILLAVGLPLPYALFGLRSSLHLGLALGLGVLTSWAYFLLLRTLDLPRLHAAIVAALALLFPWNDSLRLWSTAGINYLAVVFYLLGATLALRSLSLTGRRSILGHAGAVCLYLLSVLTYEIAAVVALLTGALYLTRTMARRALARWAVDVVVVAGALLISVVLIAHRQGSGGSLHDRISAVSTYLRQSASLLGSALIPIGTAREVKAVALLLVLATTLLAFGTHRDAIRKQLHIWFFAGFVSLVAIAAAYIVFLGYGLFPLSPGRDNRVNAFAALPWALLVYSIVMAAATLLSFRLRRELVAAALAILIAVGYAVKVRHDASRWEQAADLQVTVLSALRALPALPPGTTVYTFGHPAQVAPEIYIFAKVYDLNAAIKLVLHDESLHAYPVAEPVRVLCTSAGIVPTGPSTHGSARSRYGEALFLDIPSRHFAWIRSQRACHRNLVRFVPGPRFASS